MGDALSRVARFVAKRTTAGRRLLQYHHTMAALVREKDDLQSQLSKFGEGPPFVPNGHFYSPIPPRHEVLQYCAQTFGSFPRTLPGINLREAEQLKFLEIVES